MQTEADMKHDEKKHLLEEAWDSLDVIGSTDRPVRHFFLRCLGIILLLVSCLVVCGYFMLPIYIWVEWDGWWKWLGGIWTVANTIGFFAFITQDGFSDGG